jgi:hypothetical protein
MRKWITALVCVVVATVLLVTGCNSSETTSTKTEDEDIGVWSIDVEIVGENPTTFTNKDAAKIGPVEFQAAIKDGDTMLEPDTYKGILINDLLDYLDVTEYSVIQVEERDGYSQELEPDRIDAAGTGFAWMKNGVKLDEGSGPIMLANHGRGSKWQIKNVAKITIIK